MLESGTFLAILSGTVLAGVVTTTSGVPFLTAFAVIAVAVCGVMAARAIPKTLPAAPDLRLSFWWLRDTTELIGLACKTRQMMLCVLGISWFWAVGTLFISQLPILVSERLNGGQSVLTLALTLFSLGIGAGSFLCHQKLRGEITPRLVPIGALGISLFTFDLVWAASGVPLAVGMEPRSVLQVLSTAVGWRVGFDLFAIALSGGFFIVPLYAIIQARSRDDERARVIAGNNIINAILMAGASVFAVLAYKAGLSVIHLFLLAGIANLGVTAILIKLLPYAIPKAFMRWLLTTLFGVKVHGMEHYPKVGERAVIIVNHTSYLDAVLIGSFLPDVPLFAINTFVARKWWIRPAGLLFNLLPIDTRNPLAVKTMVHEVRKGRKCVIFPEGRITVTGSLMKVHEGPAMISSKADAPIVPIRIDGANRTIFSLLKGKVRRKLLPRISVHIMPPQRLEIPEGLSGRKRRSAARDVLYGTMTNLFLDSSPYERPLFLELCDAITKHGGKFPVLVDPEWRLTQYRSLLMKSFFVALKLRKMPVHGEHVGVLLPTSTAAVVSFFGLHAGGRIPAMLNFASSKEALRHCLAVAQIRVVLTSRLFVERAKYDVSHIPEGVTVQYLEDIVSGRELLTKALSLFGAWVAPRLMFRTLAGKVSAEDGAVVLFTSGSEALPKAVRLTHTNLNANRYQILARIECNNTDTLFNALPMFHSFGLTVGTLLPVLSGLRVFLYPSPLHYRVVPELVYEVDATMIIGTDTFLRGFAKAAHPYDFYRVRLVVAGGERLQESTRALWAEKFGGRILEGYGATETSPVLAMNTPMAYKKGSVGRFLPRVEYLLQPFEGVDDGGRLLVRGPNVMQGYLGEVFAQQCDEEACWYDTGDIVSIDTDGFVFIKGRAKRFTKIGGEMVSLAAIEQALDAAFSGFLYAAVAVADASKGERIILTTNNPNLQRDNVIAALRQAGLSELAVPKDIRLREDIPLLGTGKIDFRTLQQSVS